MTKYVIITSTIIGSLLGAYIAIHSPSLFWIKDISEPIILVEREEETAVEMEQFWFVFSQSQKINPSLSDRESLIIAREVVINSNRYGLDPELIVNVIEHESSFRIDAVSHMGAVGLMQIMPGTGKALASELGIDDYSLLDLQNNIQLGSFYLQNLLLLYDNDHHKALTAYNRGPGGLRSFIRTTGTPKSTYSETILSDY